MSTPQKGAPPLIFTLNEVNTTSGTIKVRAVSYDSHAACWLARQTASCPVLPLMRSQTLASLDPISEAAFKGSDAAYGFTGDGLELWAGVPKGDFNAETGSIVVFNGNTGAVKGTYALAGNRVRTPSSMRQSHGLWRAQHPQPYASLGHLCRGGRTASFRLARPAFAALP